MVVVDPDKIARAIEHSHSKDETPARAIEPTHSIPWPSARATGEPKSKKPTSARAIGNSDTNERTPARARMQTKPKIGTSARAKLLPTPTEATPAPEPEAKSVTESIEAAPPLDPVLFTIRQLGRTLDDIERLRIMNGNRVGAGQREGIELPWMDTISAQLDALEHNVELELKRAWRKHPLAAWAKAIPGAGEVLMGRLIAEIGAPGDRPNPGKLLAYCGHGDPGRAGQVPKGATQEELFRRGNPAAKKATWKLAYQFMRTVGSDATRLAGTSQHARRSPRSPYRDIYDARKTATVGKLHEKPVQTMRTLRSSRRRRFPVE